MPAVFGQKLSRRDSFGRYNEKKQTIRLWYDGFFASKRELDSKRYALRGQTRVAMGKRIHDMPKNQRREYEIKNVIRVKRVLRPCPRPTSGGCFDDTDEYRSAHEHYKYRRPSRSRSLERAQREIALMGDVGDGDDGGGCPNDRN